MNYYVVVKGNKPGVYEDKKEAYAQIEGYDGGEVLEFVSKIQAKLKYEELMRVLAEKKDKEKAEAAKKEAAQKETQVKQEVKEKSTDSNQFEDDILKYGKDALLIYTDGSFQETESKDKLCAYAFAVYENGKLVYEESAQVSKDEDLSSRNVLGEIVAVEKAIDYCELAYGDNYPGSIIIRHDLEHIGKWVDGTNAAKFDRALDYIDKVEASSLDLNFEHVKGHAEDERNKYVDRMAKATMRRLKRALRR